MKLGVPSAGNEVSIAQHQSILNLYFCAQTQLGLQNVIENTPVESFLQQGTVTGKASSVK